MPLDSFAFLRVRLVSSGILQSPLDSGGFPELPKFLHNSRGFRHTPQTVRGAAGSSTEGPSGK
eukprot:6288876-Pyramimonas_sp.AAC.1